MTAAAIGEAKSILADAASIVSFSGAGLSAESGISTFRDPDTGALWSKFDPAKLASPQGFAEDPDHVIGWYNARRRAIAAAPPNPAHQALAGRTDITHVTQNVDTLLERAGADDVMHLHGRIDLDRCHGGCGHEEQINLAEPPPRRTCPSCGRPMRPGVVWFGEMLPMDVFDAAEQACAACDAILVIGTSAEVYPAAGLIDIAREAGALVIVVNTQASAVVGPAEVEIIGPAGEIVPELLAALERSP